MDKPLLSLIIPMYNLHDYIAQTIDSIVNQDGFTRDCELIIVDDGSIDGSIDIVNEYLQSNDNIILKSIENHGVSFARNLGITLARGHYIWFVDGDDLLVDGSIKSIIGFLKNKPCDKLHFPIRNFSDSISVNCLTETVEFKYKEGQTKTMFDFSKLKHCFAGGVCSSIYYKDIINKEKIRFNDTIKYSEDVLFDYQYMLYCRSIAKTDTPLYLYRQRAGSAMHTKSYLQQIDSFYLLAKEYEKIEQLGKSEYITKLSRRKKWLAIKAMVVSMVQNGDIQLTKDKIKELSASKLYPYRVLLKDLFNAKNIKQLYLNILGYLYKFKFLAILATKRNKKNKK